MHSMFIPILLLLAFSPLTKVKTVRVADERLFASSHFAVLGGRGFIVNGMSKEILKLDLEQGTVVEVIGGEGDGPGEFNDAIIGLEVVDGMLAAMTAGRAVHFFDREGKFRHRRYAKESVWRIARYDRDHYVVCTMSVQNIITHGVYTQVGLVDLDLSGAVFYGQFSRHKPHKSQVLNSCRLGASRQMIAYGQAGSGEMHFYGIGRGHLKTVDLAVISDASIQYTQAAPRHSDPEGLFKKAGITIFNAPHIHPVMFVHVGEAYTVVQGAFAPGSGMKQFVAIRHSDWQVEYFNLPKPARLSHIQSDTLYVLRGSGGVVDIDVYRLAS